MDSVTKTISIFVIGLLACLLVLSPQSRLNLMSIAHEDARHVLATMPFQVNGESFKVIKLSKDGGIFIEIYKMATADKTESGELQNVFEIPDAKDVYYDFKTSLSNLFEVNIDDDKINEIIVPVLDRNLVSHLNVIKFDFDQKKFSHYVF